MESSEKKDSDNAAKEAHRLPKQIRDDLQLLNQHVESKEAFQKAFSKILETNNEPMDYALSLLVYSTKCAKKAHMQKMSGRLSLVLSDAFLQWCRTAFVNQDISPTARQKAFDTAVVSQVGHVITSICSAFKLTEDWPWLMSNIHSLLDQKKYKEAYYIVTAFKLQDEFTLEQIAIPLFFTGNDSMFTNYVKDSPALQLEFAQTIDRVCTSNYSIQDYIRYLDLQPDPPKKARPIFIKPNTLQKRLASFIETYNIDIKFCPNLYRSRSFNAVRYINKKFFSEGTIGYEAWKEMVIGLVVEDPNLRKNLLIDLVAMNEVRIALEVATALNLSQHQWPDQLMYHELNARPVPKDVFPLPNCLPLRVDEKNICFIDTPTMLITAVEDIIQNYDVVGLDAEWKPDLGIRDSKASLWQLATWDNVYLFDLIALEKPLKASLWEFMIKSIFDNDAVMKLGYGIQNDISVVTQSLGLKIEKPKNYSKLFDVGDLYTRLSVLFPSVVEEVEKEGKTQSTCCPSATKGLALLCEKVLGYTLDKREQFSDWERRPLRRTQKIYAALDAYCLLMIYEIIQRHLVKLDLTFEKVMKMPIKEPKSPGSSKDQKQQLVNEVIPRSPIPISEFRLVADGNVLGAAKYLRLLGADVLTLPDGSDKMQAVEIYQSQNRVVITSRSAYQKIAGYVPSEMRFCVDTSTLPEDQASAVVKHFNVVCREQDLGSWCSEKTQNFPTDTHSHACKELHGASAKLSTSESSQSIKTTVEARPNQSKTEILTSGLPQATMDTSLSTSAKSLKTSNKSSSRPPRGRTLTFWGQGVVNPMLNKHYNFHSALKRLNQTDALKSSNSHQPSVSEPSHVESSNQSVYLKSSPAETSKSTNQVASSILAQPSTSDTPLEYVSPSFKGTAYDFEINSSSDEDIDDMVFS